MISKGGLQSKRYVREYILTNGRMHTFSPSLFKEVPFRFLRSLFLRQSESCCSSCLA